MGQARRPLIAIVGPTAVGKTDFAVRLALRHGGEIVSADSRQVYRGMDIGTAKPSPEQRRLVPHHLVDILEPDHDFSVAAFLLLARRAIRSIRRRGRLPLVVGGTGQYLWALLERWRLTPGAPDPSLRRDLERRLVAEGLPALVGELERQAPAVVRRLDRRNPRRVLRALELATSGGAPRPRQRGSSLLPDTYVIGLTLPRSELYRRIDQRVDGMVERGLAEEVRRLLERCGPATPVLGSLGYGQLAAYLQGCLTLAEAVGRMKSATHRFARQQHNWFRPGDPRIHWYNADEMGLRNACSDVAVFLDAAVAARPSPATP